LRVAPTTEEDSEDIIRIPNTIDRHEPGQKEKYQVLIVNLIASSDMTIEVFVVEGPGLDFFFLI
jgi:hypothetical protein